MSFDDQLFDRVRRRSHLDDALSQLTDQIRIYGPGEGPRGILARGADELTSEPSVKQALTEFSVGQILDEARVAPPASRVTLVIASEVPVVAAAYLMDRHQERIAIVPTPTGPAFVQVDAVQRITRGMARAYEQAVVGAIEPQSGATFGPYRGPGAMDAAFTISRQAFRDIIGRVVSSLFCYECLEDPFHAFSTVDEKDNCIYMEDHFPKTHVDVKSVACTGV